MQLAVRDHCGDFRVEYTAVIGVFAGVGRFELAGIVEPTVIGATMQAVKIKHSVDSDSDPYGKLRNVLSNFETRRVRTTLPSTTPQDFFLAERSRLRSQVRPHADVLFPAVAPGSASRLVPLQLRSASVVSRPSKAASKNSSCHR